MIYDQSLQRENEITLLAVQALLGLISGDLIAVAVRIEEGCVRLIFWACRKSSDLEGDAEEATFELDALFSDDHPLIEYEIRIGEPDANSIGSGERLIYWAKSRDGHRDSSEEVDAP
ncbi:hypothetical protein JHN59_24210 [Streptomyces sp. MBT49]|uniref:hypothetical protein n=1 Tax=Streptomyces TaxID=1883 RepID=UPI00190A640B|nr:hypothetical protein [Streptomyces sp. MBT49]MBK3627892.1 hypothetical protein [Streptomyces sp. MBT49]